MFNIQRELPLSFTQSNEVSPSANEDSHNVGKITRRSHQKSRAGCKQCKTRRIKCDEAKPQCSNCKRRKLHCGFTESADSSPQNSRGNEPSFGSIELPISEIELAYHYTTSTCFSLSAWPTGGIAARNQMDEIGFKHPYVLHLMFAFTALHLAHCRPHRREEYVATADRHYERALILLTPLISNLDPENCDAVLLAVQLVCFVSWGRGPQPGEYLAFGRDKRSDWLILFRGIRASRSSFERLEHDRKNSPAARGIGRPLPTQEVPDQYEQHLDDLKEHVKSMSKNTSGYESDVQAVDILREMYDNRYHGTDGEYHVSFGWLYRVTDDFLERLQQHDPIPMIIYAYFVVLVRVLEQFWYMQGWTHHIMTGIWELMPKEQKAWLDWPMKRIGWIKP